MSDLLQALFGTDKPVIAMMHAGALPGRPRHDPAKDLRDTLARDLDVLQRAGVDGLLFCNEADLPYQLRTGPEIAAAMAALIGELKADITRPFGVDIVWDPIASVAVARATGAAFIREVVTGVYESDLGVMRPSFGTIKAYQTQIKAADVAIFANITPEFASPLGHTTKGRTTQGRTTQGRTTQERALSAAFLGVDAILVTGPITGSPTDLAELRDVKAAVPRTPVLASTGVTVDTVPETLAAADGVIVGTHLKRDGVTWNPVDEARATAFMAAATHARDKMVV